MLTYLSAARHPWAALVFVTPALLLYEFGVHSLGGADPHALRNGADVWLRWALGRYGLAQAWAAPALIVLALIVPALWRWGTRPKEPLATLCGMTVESVVFAVGLWVVARNLGGLLPPPAPAPAPPPPAVAASVPEPAPAKPVTVRTPAAGQVVTYIGAGLYEEVLFRLGLFSALALVLRLAGLPGPLVLLLAASGGALAFAAAHHLGPAGEPVSPDRFVFRTVAGLYFTLVFWLRGLGVAAGAHAGYDILVGTAVG